MASVDRVSGKYIARWRDLDGRQRKKTFTRLTDAKRFITSVEASKQRGDYIDVHDTTTVAAYARRWAGSRAHRPSSARRVESLIRNHIEGTPLGGRRLASVVPSEVQAWATDRASVMAPTTVRNLVGLLRSVYASAVMDRLVAVSPVQRVALPRAHRPRVVPLSVEQVRDLALAIPPRNYAMVLAQAGLGLRVGELLGLRVQDVDFLRRTVRIELQLSERGKERIEPKTPRSKRTLPMPSFVAEALAAHLSQYPAGSDGSIFTTVQGTPYRQDYYSSLIFKKAVERSGLPLDTHPHSLRHHYASVLLTAGESVSAVAERLGHDDATQVLKTYGHLMPGGEDRTRRALDDAWCATGAPSVQAATS